MPRSLVIVLGDQLDRRSAAFDAFDGSRDRAGDAPAGTHDAPRLIRADAEHLGGAAVICLALALLALWATRNRGRARRRLFCNTLGFLAVVTAGLTTGTIVWTANAWLTVGVSALWGRLQ